MKSWILKSSAVSLLLVLGVLLFAPMARLQQEDLFNDSFNSIENRLGNARPGEAPVEIIDFSEKLWGNLSQEIIDILEGQEFDGLQAIKKQFEEENLTPQEQVQALEDFGLSNAQANQVYSEMTRAGESQLNTVVLTVMRALKILIQWVAILIILVAGLKMILAQGEENVITEQKKHLLYAGVGLVLILLIEQMVNVIYGVPGVAKTLTTFDYEFSDEILGLVAYIKSLLGILAVAMIIVSGARTLFAFGEEEKITTQRKALLWVGVGIILVIIDQVIVENIFIAPVQPIVENPDAPSVIAESNVATIIAVLANVAKFGLGFLGLIAFGALIYGGALFISNYANAEQTDKAKKIILHALMGIVIILSAFAVVATLIDFSV